jgi:hypothetical protein
MRLTQGVDHLAVAQTIIACILFCHPFAAKGLRLKGVVAVYEGRGGGANMCIDALEVRSVTDSADQILAQLAKVLAEPHFVLLPPIIWRNKGTKDIITEIMPHSCDELMMARLNEATGSRNVYHSLIML